MCTLIMKWDPGSSEPLLVGANRDENPQRASVPWALRWRKIYCPKDVRGGTWIGVNTRGLFAALTNLDVERPSRGRETRGHLVMSALVAYKVDDAITKTVSMMNRKIYNAFNLLLADESRLVAISGMGSSGDVKITNLAPGLHIVNGWGIDNWYLPRCEIVRRRIEEDHMGMREVLAQHGDGTPKGSVCIHELNGKNDHATVSSCVIKVGPRWEHMRIWHVNQQPCLDLEHWEHFRMELKDEDFGNGR